MAPQITNSGIATERMPTARPEMMFVAGPVSEASAMVRIGLAAVYHSVARPMMIPASVPTTTAQKGPIGLGLPLARVRPRSTRCVIRYAAPRKRPAAMKVAQRSAPAGLNRSSTRNSAMATRLATRPASV